MGSCGSAGSGGGDSQEGSSSEGGLRAGEPKLHGRRTRREGLGRNRPKIQRDDPGGGRHFGDGRVRSENGCLGPGRGGVGISKSSDAASRSGLCIGERESVGNGREGKVSQILFQPE